MNTNSRKKEKAILVLLLLVIALMTVGFALYNATLTINGTVTVKASKWLVLWDSGDGVSVSSGDCAAASGDLDTTANEPTNFKFEVVLNKPGAFYEATIQAHNYGTFDAVLKTLNMSALTTAQNKYLKYTVTYNGTTYTAGTTALAQSISGVTLAAGAKHPVKVKVEYLMPNDESDLPSTDQTITVTGSLVYEQKEN